MDWQKSILVFSLLLAVMSMPFSMPVCHIALILYVIAWMTEGRWHEKATIFMDTPLLWGYVAFMFAHLIGIIYSDDPSNGWFNVEKKLFLFLLPLAIATTFGLERKIVQLLLKGFILTCVIATLFCLAVAFMHYQNALHQTNFDGYSLSMYRQLNPGSHSIWMYLSYIELASGIGIHPTYLALYLVFSALLLLHFYSGSFKTYSSFKKAGIVLLFLYLEIMIALLSSRILVFSFLIVLIGSLLYVARINQVRPVYQAFFVLTATCMLFFIILLNPVSRYRNFQEPFMRETYLPATNGLYSYSTGIRKSLWWMGLNTIMDVNPLIGVGTGDVKESIRKMSARLGEQNIIHSDDPHNQFVYTQIGLGAIGLTLLLICLYVPAWIAYQQNNFFYLAFSMVFSLVCITESTLESQKGIVFFSVFNSLLVFQYAKLNMLSTKRLTYG